MSMVRPDIFACLFDRKNSSYNSALKEAGIPSLYDRRASLSSDLFNDIVIDINHKLAGLLPRRSAPKATLY